MQPVRWSELTFLGGGDRSTFMITEYKRKSFALTVGGFLLFGLTLCLSWLGDHFPVLPASWFEAGYLTCLSLSFVLVIFGVCYYASAKGYSAAWGAVFLLMTCLGWLILVFLPDKEKDYPDEPPEKIPFPDQAAKASLIAPLLAFLTGVLMQAQIHQNQINRLILGSLSTCFLVAGLILGVVALVLAATRRCEQAGILKKAIAGTAINGIFILGIFILIPLMGNWRLDLNPGHLKFTYDRDGVRFSHYASWTKAEFPYDSGVVPHVVMQGPHESVTLHFFPPLDQGTLQDHADQFMQQEREYYQTEMRARSVQITRQPVVGKVGGIARAGFQYHVTGETADAALSITWYYFILSDARHKIIVAIQMEDGYREQGNAGIDLILNTLKVDGMAAPEPAGRGMADTNIVRTDSPPRLNVKMIVYKPQGACALIGNKTVMAGDVFEGFTIIAIEKDSITVQSPTGVKKALRLGDNLK
jgi:hypothetical protein